MNARQQTALLYPCGRAVEVIDPRFARERRTRQIYVLRSLLTVNR